ncbi:ferredoxin--NADP reductase, partial [Vibrio diabolicus]
KYLIEQLQQRYEGRLKYIPIVSREVVDGQLQGRIPELIESGRLSNAADVPFSAQSSFVMMCGNPQMIKDTLPVLQDLGLEKYRPKTGGNIIYERYW